MNIYKLTILLVALVVFFEIGLVFAADSSSDNPFIFGIRRGNQGTFGGFLPSIEKCGKVKKDPQGNITREFDFGSCLLWFFNKLLSIIYTLALFLGVIYLVYAGIEYITKPGNAQQTHQRLIWGITGIVVAIIAFSLVKAIEISLSTDEIAPTTPITTGGTGGTGTGSTTETAKPKVLISNTSITPTATGYNLIFTERLDTTNSTIKSCSVGLRIFNLSRGTTKQYTFTSDNFTTMHGRTDDGGIAINLPSDSKAGDKIQLQFLQNQNCQIPSPISLTVPKSSLVPVVIGKPTVKISGVGFNTEKTAIVFTAYLSKELPAGKNCSIGVNFSNLSTGQFVQGTGEKTPLVNQQKVFRFDIPKEFTTAINQKISLSFVPTPGSYCSTQPNTATLTVPKAIEVAAGRPIIQIIAPPEILGQQKLTIKIPISLADIVRQVFGYFEQTRLYDPPFYLKIMYSVPNNQNSGTCTFVVNAAGIRVIRYYNYEAISLKSFNQLFSFNLKFERGVQNYAKMLPIGLSNNIIQKVKLQAIELRGCDYGVAGGNIGNWGTYITTITTQ